MRFRIGFFVLCFMLIFSNIGFATNIALTATATANEEYFPPAYGADKAIDGNMATNWGATGFGTIADPDWLIVDLGSTFAVDQITLRMNDSQYDSQYGNDYNLYYSNDNVSWTSIGSGSIFDDPNTAQNSDDWVFSGNPMRYVKYEVVGGLHWSLLHEMEVYSQTSPVPEPSTLLLLGVGITGIILGKRKKNEK